MRKVLWNNRILAINILLLAVVKLSLVYPASGLVGVISNSPVFSKEEIVQETNIFRAQIDQPALKTSSTLQAAAADKLEDMVTNQYFAHISPQGIDPWHWLTVNNYKYAYAGENLAIGFFDAADTVQAWANSPSHRKNMASSDFSEIGVAVQSATIGELKGVVVVQLFGKPIVQKALPTPQVISIAKTPAPIKTPVTTPLSQPEAGPPPAETPAPSSTVTAEREAPILLAYVKDRIINPTSPDIPDENGNVTTHPQGHSLAMSLDRTFVIYSGIIVLLSMLLIIFSAGSRAYWPLTALHVIIFLTALLLEPVVINRLAIIL